MTRSLVEKQFGPSARHYAECEVHAAGESLARLVALTSPGSDWLVLDVATGAGHTAAAFAPHVASVIASDITDEMLAETARLAKERGLVNMSTAHAQADDLGFEDATFDVVACRLAAHHFPDIKRFVAESHRVLKPQGLIAVVDNVTPDEVTLPNLTSAEIAAAEESYNAFETLRDPSHARALSAVEWKQTLQDIGFTLTAFEQFAKEMAFDPWVERMRCAPDTIKTLRGIVEGESALARFLQPRELDGQLMFSLQEAVIVARRD